MKIEYFSGFIIRLCVLKSPKIIDELWELRKPYFRKHCQIGREIENIVRILSNPATLAFQVLRLQVQTITLTVRNHFYGNGMKTGKSYEEWNKDTIHRSLWIIFENKQRCKILVTLFTVWKSHSEHTGFISHWSPV